MVFKSTEMLSICAVISLLFTAGLSGNVNSAFASGHPLTNPVTTMTQADPEGDVWDDLEILIDWLCVIVVCDDTVTSARETSTLSGASHVPQALKFIAFGERFAASGVRSGADAATIEEAKTKVDWILDCFQRKGMVLTMEEAGDFGATYSRMIDLRTALDNY
ncbi:hypothetical protein BH11PLA1_BH11PLA1_18720 [soil metagenome]